ncbi:MAG: hypothetical protein CM15mP83_0830 [Flavobacteriaceae bacterium]|nr:MAG: hypothetical protein CM15mP83_0830 [Flavobacteriaceae bacterium]
MMDIDLPQDRKWIGIAPFAAHPGKVYPLDLMQKVVGYLQQQHSVFVWHGPKETDQINTWAKPILMLFRRLWNYPFRDNST